jgi:phosphoenolpyruvate---glycerone phosphotransferase subunit DhaL
MDEVSKDAVLQWLRHLNDVYNENKQYLTRLDSPIGDADHGTNMARGFNKVVEKLSEFETSSISEIFKAVGVTLVSTIGGSSGPLYGTFFLRAANAIESSQSLTMDSLVDLFEAGLDGLCARGKTELGDKTMVDAFAPAVTALKQARDDGKSLNEALRAAVDAAEQGMKETIPMLARKGRASYLGERSIGHQDPGATSTHLLFKAAADTWGSGD